MGLTNLPVEDIETLASSLSTQATQLEGQLNTLYRSAQRDPNFTGTAANSYDAFLEKWNTSQQSMLESIRGASRLLDNYAKKLREDDISVGNIFDQ